MGRLSAIDMDIGYWKQAVAALKEGNVELFFEKFELLRNRFFLEKRRENDYIISKLKGLPVPIYMETGQDLGNLAKKFITDCYTETHGAALPDLDAMARVVDADPNFRGRLDEPVPGDRETFVDFFKKLHKKLVSSHEFSPLDFSALMSEAEAEVDNDTLAMIRAYLVHYDLVSIVGEAEQRDLDVDHPEFSKLLESVARYKNISLILNNFLPALSRDSTEEEKRIKFLRRILRRDHLIKTYPGLSLLEQQLVLNALESEWSLTLTPEASGDFLEELRKGIETQAHVEEHRQHAYEISGLMAHVGGHEQFFGTEEVFAKKAGFESRSRRRMVRPDPFKKFTDRLDASSAGSTALVVHGHIKEEYAKFHAHNQVDKGCYTDPRNVYLGFSLNPEQVLAILNNADSILLTDKQVDELLNGVSGKLRDFDRSRYVNVQGFFKESRTIHISELLRGRVIEHCTGFSPEALASCSRTRQIELFRIYSEIKKSEIAAQADYHKKIQAYSETPDLVNLEDLKQLSLLALNKLLIELQVKKGKSWSRALLERKINLIKESLEAIRTGAVCHNKQGLMSYLGSLQGKYSVLAKHRHFWSALFFKTDSQRSIGNLIGKLNASKQHCLEAHAARYASDEPESIGNDPSRLGLR